MHGYIRGSATRSCGSPGFTHLPLFIIIISSETTCSSQCCRAGLPRVGQQRPMNDVARSGQVKAGFLMIRVSDRLQGSEYEALDVSKLLVPTDPAQSRGRACPRRCRCAQRKVMAAVQDSSRHELLMDQRSPQLAGGFCYSPAARDDGTNGRCKRPLPRCRAEGPKWGEHGRFCLKTPGAGYRHAMLTRCP